MPAQTPERSSFGMEDSELFGTSSKSVQEQVLSGQVLLMDYRPNSAFCRAHIEGALNVCLPGILLRRLQKGNLSLKCLIQGDEGKDLFVKMASKVPLILYDENSSNINANSDAPFVLLLRRLKEVGYRVSYLRGGYILIFIITVIMVIVLLLIGKFCSYNFYKESWSSKIT